MEIHIANETYNLADSIDRDVAINEAARLRAQSKQIDFHVEEFAKAFRHMFQDGVKHGTGQATLSVTQCGEDKTDALDISKVLEAYGISKETHPQFYTKKIKARRQSVTFTQNTTTEMIKNLKRGRC